MANVAPGVLGAASRVVNAGSADFLLDEALAKAALKAVEQMDRLRVPSGTVLNTTAVSEGDAIRRCLAFSQSSLSWIRREPASFPCGVHTLQVYWESTAGGEGAQ